ncbi:MAG: hypothetical protein WA151_14815, partial [Desulfatirhabdiaceae bacterium]
FMGPLGFLRRAGEQTAFSQRRQGPRNAGCAVMRRGDLKEDWLLFFDKVMFCKVSRARFAGNLVENPIAECQSL